MTEKLLTADEVAGWLHLHRGTLYSMVRDRRFPAPLRVGARAVRWRESDVLRWLDARPPGGGQPRRPAIAAD